MLIIKKRIIHLLIYLTIPCSDCFYFSPNLFSITFQKGEIFREISEVRDVCAYRPLVNINGHQPMKAINRSEVIKGLQMQEVNLIKDASFCQLLRKRLFFS